MCGNSYLDDFVFKNATMKHNVMSDNTCTEKHILKKNLFSLKPEKIVTCPIWKSFKCISVAGAAF